MDLLPLTISKGPLLTDCKNRMGLLSLTLRMGLLSLIVRKGPPPTDCVDWPLLTGMDWFLPTHCVDGPPLTDCEAGLLPLAISKWPHQQGLAWPS